MLSRHRLHGLAVATSLAEHGLATGEPREADLLIEELREPLDPEAPGTRLLDRRSPHGQVRLVRREGRHEFSFGGHFEAVLEDRRVAVRGPGGDPDALAIFAYGTATALWLALRGELVLHASAVLWRGGVVAFAAASGGGKSTLALTACELGAKLVSDDALRVRVEDGRAVVWPGTRELRSRDERATAWPSRRTSDGRIALTPPPVSGEGPWPLLSVVLPRLVDPASAVSVARAPAGRALVALGAQVRAGTLDDPDLRRREFAQLAALAGRGLIVVAELPRTPAHLAEIVLTLLRHSSA